MIAARVPNARRREFWFGIQDYLMVDRRIGSVRVSAGVLAPTCVVGRCMQAVGSSGNSGKCVKRRAVTLSHQLGPVRGRIHASRPRQRAQRREASRELTEIREPPELSESAAIDEKISSAKSSEGISEECHPARSEGICTSLALGADQSYLESRAVCARAPPPLARPSADSSLDCARGKRRGGCPGRSRRAPRNDSSSELP
jgi:hypothetical protein